MADRHTTDVNLKYRKRKADDDEETSKHTMTKQGSMESGYGSLSGPMRGMELLSQSSLDDANDKSISRQISNNNDLVFDDECQKDGSEITNSVTTLENQEEFEQTETFFSQHKFVIRTNLTTKHETKEWIWRHSLKAIPEADSDELRQCFRNEEMLLDSMNGMKVDSWEHHVLIRTLIAAIKQNKVRFEFRSEYGKLESVEVKDCEPYVQSNDGVTTSGDLDCDQIDNVEPNRTARDCVIKNNHLPKYMKVNGEDLTCEPIPAPLLKRFKFDIKYYSGTEDGTLYPEEGIVFLCTLRSEFNSQNGTDSVVTLVECENDKGSIGYTPAAKAHGDVTIPPDKSLPKDPRFFIFKGREDKCTLRSALYPDFFLAVEKEEVIMKCIQTKKEDLELTLANDPQVQFQFFQHGPGNKQYESSV